MVSRRLDYRIAGLLTGLLAGAMGEGVAHAVPSTMTQQGLLLDQSNNPVSGQQTFVFAIYSTADGRHARSLDGDADDHARRRILLGAARLGDDAARSRRRSSAARRCTSASRSGPTPR